MSNQETSEYPYWVNKNEQCMWCNQFSDLSYVGVSDLEDAVVMEYQCSNPKCYSIGVLGSPAKQIIRMDGKNAVDAFRRKLNQKHYKTVPDYEVP